MHDPVLLNLLNSLPKRDKMLGNWFYKFNKKRVLVLDPLFI